MVANVKIGARMKVMLGGVTYEHDGNDDRDGVSDNR